MLALEVESGHLALLPAPPPGTCCKSFPSTQVSRGPPHASAVLVGNQTPGIPPSSGSQPRGRTDWGQFPGWYKSARTLWGHLRMGVVVFRAPTAQSGLRGSRASTFRIGGSPRSGLLTASVRPPPPLLLSSEQLLDFPVLVFGREKGQEDSGGLGERPFPGDPIG